MKLCRICGRPISAFVFDGYCERCRPTVRTAAQPEQLRAEPSGALTTIARMAPAPMYELSAGTTPLEALNRLERKLDRIAGALERVAAAFEYEPATPAMDELPRFEGSD